MVTAPVGDRRARQIQRTELLGGEQQRQAAGEAAARAGAAHADARNRGLSETRMRGIKGRLATDLPQGGKAEDAPLTSPVARWAAFVLCGDWR